MGSKGGTAKVAVALLVGAASLTACGDPPAARATSEDTTTTTSTDPGSGVTTSTTSAVPDGGLMFQEIPAEGPGTWERIELPTGTELATSSARPALVLRRTADGALGVLDAADPTRPPRWVPPPPGHAEADGQVRVIGAGLYATGRDGWYRLDGTAWTSLGAWGMPVADDGERRAFLAGSSYDQVPYELRLESGGRTEVVDDRWSVAYLVGGRLVTLTTDPPEVRSGYTRAAELVIRRWDDTRSAWVTTPGGPAILPGYRYAESAVLRAWVDGERLLVCTPDGVASFDPGADSLGPPTAVDDARCAELTPGLSWIVGGPTGLLMVTASTDEQGVATAGLHHAPSPTAPSAVVPIPSIRGSNPMAIQLVTATPDGFVVLLDRTFLRYRPG